MNRHVLRNVIWGLVLIGLGVIFILFLTGTFDFDKDAGDFIAEILQHTGLFYLSLEAYPEYFQAQRIMGLILEAWSWWLSEVFS